MPNYCKYQKKCGFTLIELMVVIAIIAILSAIAISSFSTLQKKSRDTQRMSDLKIIQSALEQYHADWGFYPKYGCASPLFISSGSINSGLGRPAPIPTPIITYLSTIPQDPSDPTHPYIYASFPYHAPNTRCANGPGDYCTFYCLYAKMEISSNGNGGEDGSEYPVPTECFSPPNSSNCRGGKTSEHNYIVTSP